jgi:hypothetical protein
MVEYAFQYTVSQSRHATLARQQREKRDRRPSGSQRGDPFAATRPCTLYDRLYAGSQFLGTFKAEHADFQQLYHKVFQLVPKLVLESTADTKASALILELMSASLSDFDDILLLCSYDRHWGALKLLRSLFERTITLKYLAQHPAEIEAFLEFDAVDWSIILSGIEKRYSITAKPETTKHFHEAAGQVKSRFRRCPKCGNRKQNSWTPYSSVELAEKTGLAYLHFEGFVLPTKFIHPTYFGASQVSRDSPAPLANILKTTHILTLETVLAHGRYFQNDPLASPAVIEAIRDFLGVWKFAETAFGLGENATRAGLIFIPFNRVDEAPESEAT